MPPDGARVSSVASAAVLIQIAFVYVFAGFAKTGPAWLEDGDAIYLALHNEFLVTGIGPWFRQFEGLMWAMTPLVVAFERSSLLWIFFPWCTPYARVASIAAIAASAAAIAAAGSSVLAGFEGGISLPS